MSDIRLASPRRIRTDISSRKCRPAVAGNLSRFATQAGAARQVAAYHGLIVRTCGCALHWRKFQPNHDQHKCTHDFNTSENVPKISPMRTITVASHPLLNECSEPIVTCRIHVSSLHSCVGMITFQGKIFAGRMNIKILFCREVANVRRLSWHTCQWLMGDQMAHRIVCQGV